MAKRGIISGMAVLLMTAACGNTDVKLGDRPQFSNGTNAVTVLAYDGISGAPVTTATLTMRVGPNVLTATADGNAYTFTNVPTSDYPVYASAAGYLDFVGTTGTLGGGGTLASPNYQLFSLPMFPNTNVSSNLTVRVFDHQGVAVPNGQVVSTLTSNPAEQFGTTLDNALGGDYGFKPAVKVYTVDANGTASVPSADLVAGATYVLRVFAARNAAGDYLGDPAPVTQTYVPNVSHEQVNFFMGSPVTPAPIVTRTSNGKPNGTTPVAPVADSTFTIYFAEAIQLCNDATQHDYYTISAGTATKPAVGTSDNVTFTPAADGLSLTVKAAFDNTPSAGQTVTYQNIKVQVQGTTNCVGLSTLDYWGTGAAVDLSVKLAN